MAEKFRGFGQGDVLELRLNGSPTPLAITETDDEWIDGQVYANRPQPTAGSHAAYISAAATTDAEPLLMLQLDGGRARESLRPGPNELSVRVAGRGRHANFRDGAGNGMRIVLEKAEAHVLPAEPERSKL